MSIETSRVSLGARMRRALPKPVKLALVAPAYRVAVLCLPRSVRELPETDNRLLAATALGKWLERWPRAARRRLVGWIAVVVAYRYSGFREVVIAAEVQIRCRRGDLETALSLLSSAPPEIRRNMPLGMMRRAIGMKQSRPSVPGFIDQLLGADKNYFAGRFCPKPFGDLEIISNGNVYICCPSYLPQYIGNADRQTASLSGLINSRHAKRIRKSILDQSFSYCDWTQCNAIQAERLPLRTEISDPRMRGFIEADDGIVEGPTEVRLSHDQTCNLWCPSCRTERITAKGEQLDRIMSMTQRVVVPALATAQTVMMNGHGDVFSSRSCRNTLHSISEDTHPGLELVFITNGVLFSEEEWAKFPNIHRKVRSIRVSIDASTPQTYARVRLGGDWQKLNTNLVFLSRLRREGVIAEFMISFVVQRENFREMTDFYRMGLGLGCDCVVIEHLMDWRTWDEKTFRRNAVHLPENPDYADYVAAARELQTAAAELGRLSFDLSFP